MRPLLKRLFPNLYPLMAEWPGEKWAVLPLALFFLISSLAGLAHLVLYDLGWYDAKITAMTGYPTPRDLSNQGVE